MGPYGPGPGGRAGGRAVGRAAHLLVFLLVFFCLEAHYTDCYLRQGDGGTKTACFGSKTCFLR